METHGLHSGGTELQKESLKILRDIRFQNELARIDREWESDRRQLLVSGRNGEQLIPTPGSALMDLFVALFGVIWTVLAIGMTREEFPGFISLLFPLFGIAFVVVAIVNGIQKFSLAERYTQAFDHYKLRRQQAEYDYKKSN